MGTHFCTRPVLFVLLISSVVPACLQAATVSVCDSSELVEAGAGQQLYDASGQLVTLTVSDESPADTSCRTLELPLAAAAVRWLTLSDIPLSELPTALALQGRFLDASAEISEVIRAGELPTEPDFLPFGDNLSAHFDAKPFGLEERARFNDSAELVCAAGSEAAGVALRSTFRWPQLQGMMIEFEVSGAGSFEFAIADAALDTRGTALTLGAVTLAATSESAVTLRYPLPANAEPWTTVTLLCPATAATLRLGSFRLLPPAPVQRAGSRRSTWLWTPSLWLEDPELAWSIAEQENLDKLHVTVPLSDNGEVENAEALAAFIREGRRRKIEVWAVVGDRRDVLPASREALLRRARAYLAYNAAHKGDGALGGLQLDIEPYLLPGYTLAPAYWRNRYVETVTAVHAELASQLPLDLVLPVWWGTHPDWGSALLNALVLPDLSLTIMNYRTVPAALRAGALPFLAWGQRNRVPVTMALETGSISRDGSSETRRHYGAGSEGELWLLPIDGMALLVLLDGNHSGLPGQAYVRAGETEFSNGNITFAEAPANLAALATLLEGEWAVWPAFAGLAIHGLEEKYRPGGQE